MNSSFIIEVLYLFFISLIFAVLEIQIEGKKGWASALPTWRPNPDNLISKIYRLILFGKDVTGYHLVIFTLLLAILHYPFFVGRVWNLSQEFVTLSLFFLFTIFWDFIWFLLNPDYGLQHFNKENIWWHKKWFFFLPVDYWAGLMTSALFYIKFSFNIGLLKEWLGIVGLFFAPTILIIIFDAISQNFKRKIED